MHYIIQSSHIKPVKGSLPDVRYRYISNESQIPWHYYITGDREQAYLFDESELEEAQVIADCWQMKIKEI